MVGGGEGGWEMLDLKVRWVGVVSYGGQILDLAHCTEIHSVVAAVHAAPLRLFISCMGIYFSLRKHRRNVMP